MSTETETPVRSRRSLAGVVFVVAVLGFGAGTLAAMLLYANITERKLEAQRTTVEIVKLTESTVDAAEWGKNFPRQYDGYTRTADNARSRFRWSEGRPPTSGDGVPPEAVEDAGKADSKLTGDPRLRKIFNGYAFAIDYRERRGHAFMLEDQRETERVKQKPQPGTCLNCHASNVVAYRQVGLESGAPGSLTDPLFS